MYYLIFYFFLLAQILFRVHNELLEDITDDHC